MPAVAEPVRKPSLDGFSTPPPRKETANGYMSVQQPTTLVTTPVIQMQNFSMDDEPATANYDDLNGTMYTLEPCLSPPPAIPLRQRLIGTWKLESYVAYPGPTSIIRKQTYPMTKNVTGSIMYTPDGYMSAQMLIPGQQTFKRGEGEDPQWTEAAKRFFAYSGPYYITNEGPGREEILRHTFQVCNLPGWIGDIQIRTHRFEEDGQVLVLGSETPTEIKVCIFLEKSLCYSFFLLSSLGSLLGRQADTRPQVATGARQFAWRPTASYTADQDQRAWRALMRAVDEAFLQCSSSTMTERGVASTQQRR